MLDGVAADPHVVRLPGLLHRAAPVPGCRMRGYIFADPGRDRRLDRGVVFRLSAGNAEPDSSDRLDSAVAAAPIDLLA